MYTRYVLLFTNTTLVHRYISIRQRSIYPAIKLTETKIVLTSSCDQLMLDTDQERLCLSFVCVDLSVLTNFSGKACSVRDLT